MGGQSASSRRREGRNAYYPEGSPNELCPYKDKSYAKDWMDGWRDEAVEREYQEYLQMKADRERWEYLNDKYGE